MFINQFAILWVFNTSGGVIMKVDFGGVEETVVTREEFTLEKSLSTLKDVPISVLGYGSQGPGQSQNLRDNGFNVVVGQRESYSKPGEEPTSWEKALKDSWEPGINLFSSLEEAADRGTIIVNLLSDAGQKMTWPSLEKYVVPGKTLYFSHGFGIHFNEHTGIKPRDGVDVIMVAPKGAGLSVRGNFLNGSGINASYAVEKNFTGKALETTIAMGIGIGAGYLFETTFRNEVVSDHFGERAFLLGEVWALAEASYKSLRLKDDMPTADAFIHSSEQITQVILPLIGRGGAAEVYRQAVEAGEFGTVLKYQTAVREATKPILGELYKSVASGIEAKIALESNSDKNYRQKLNSELGDINKREMWVTGKLVREAGGDRTYGLRITNWPLAGTIIGVPEAQYQTLIDNGHSPSEAFNETVEEATQSLNQFYQQKGVSHLLGVCSTTAQRGSLDWGPKFREVLERQVFLAGERNYPIETFATLDYSSTRPNMWVVGDVVRSLRPENLKK